MTPSETEHGFTGQARNSAEKKEEKIAVRESFESARMKRILSALLIAEH